MSEVKLQVDSTHWSVLAAVYKSKFSETGVGARKALLAKANSLRPFSRATGILDNASGPGPIITHLLEDYDVPNNCKLTCADISEGMLQQIEKTKEEKIKEDPESSWKRIVTVTNDAQDLKDIADQSQSHVISSFVFMILEDSDKALSECRRVLQEHGVLGCSTWKRSDWMDIMHLISEIRPDRKIPSMAPRWTQPKLMQAGLEKAGFQNVTVQEEAVEMTFETREGIIDFILKNMPHMVLLLQDWEEEDIRRLKARMNEEMLKLCGEAEPGVMHGTALVAAGQK